MGRYDMNRFATALSAAIPSSGSDASQSSYLRDSPRVASPLDPQVVVEQYRSKSATTALYDDPRSTHYQAPMTKWDPATNPPRRPDLLRHKTEEGTSRSVSPGRRGFSRERKDQSVRVDALANRKGAGRLGAMAKGPDDKYAVGGGMALKVVQITRPASGDATPVPEELAGRRKSQKEQALGKGPGGIGVTEVVNLWRGSMAVGKGVNDISWGTGAFAHKLVTASPSGNFLLFDLNRGKLEKEISGGHPRPLNVVRLCQTPAHAHLLISGGTEGHAKMWDLRDRDPVNRKYFKHAASITSLCFSPDDPHQFVVGLENGAIQRYDLRHQKNGRVWGAHGSKAVLDLQWKEGSSHVSGQGWLASAGADRTVQIWDMAQSWDRGPTSLHTLHTAYPLRRVAWRPEHDTELVVIPLADSQAGSLVDPSIASVSQGLGQESVALDEDSHLEIWDVRRHHIAKYALPTVGGTAVEAAWSDADTLVTAHQNGMFAQLDIRNKTIPLDSIPRQIMSWSSRGEVTYGIDRFKQGEIPFDDPKPEFSNHWDKLGQRQKGPADPPYEPLQALGFLSLPVFDNDEFTYLANHYKIEGQTAEELCAWNGGVALMAGRTDDARCWSLLQQYIEDVAPTPDSQFSENVFDKSTKTRQQSDSALHSPTAGPTEMTKSPIANESVSTFSPEVIPLERLGVHDDSNDDVEELVSDSSSSSGSGSGSITPGVTRTRFITFAPHGTERTDLRASTSTAVPKYSNPQSQPPSRERSRQLRPKAHRRHSSSEEDDAYPDPYGISIHDRRSRQSSANTSRSSARSSPNIAPNQRVSTIKGSPVMLPSRATRDRDPASGPGQSSGSGTGSGRQSVSGSTRPSLAGSTRPSLVGGNGNGNGKRDKSGLVPTSRGWMDPAALERYKQERGEAVLQWWRSYVDDGDAQMATILYVVGSQVVNFPKKQAERVAHCYIEMLEQHRLAVPAAYIRRHAQITSLQIVLGDMGVTHLTYCSRCGKGTGSLEDVGMHNHGKKFWYCKKCRLPAKSCVICQEGVKGLFMACAKCRHGGHQACMRNFYLDAPLNLPPVDSAGHILSNVPSNDRDYLPLYGYGTSHESSINIMGGDRTSGETARSDAVRRQTVLGWTGCPKGCGCKCRIVPIERELEEL